MSGMGRYVGVCVGGPWDGTEFDCDVLSWRVNERGPKPLSAGVTLTLKPRYGTYVWDMKRKIWKWH